MTADRISSAVDVDRLPDGPTSRMRQLLPHLVDPVDPTSVYADLPSASHRPSVRLNMITSVDGATAIAGRSGELGGDAMLSCSSMSSA